MSAVLSLNSTSRATITVAITNRKNAKQGRLYVVDKKMGIGFTETASRSALAQTEGEKGRGGEGGSHHVLSYLG